MTVQDNFNLNPGTKIFNPFLPTPDFKQAGFMIIVITAISYFRNI
jgi:hypothetical protein